jgi:hypothetical protein
MLIAFGAIAGAYWFKRQAQEPSTRLPEQLPELPNLETDPQGYQRALARTRQAQDVARAVSYMHAGEPARCACTAVQGMVANQQQQQQ